MKKYNFDEIIDRRNSDCIKWDALTHFFGADDILPAWVADTDFRTPDFIMEAIRKRMEHEVLGYTYRGTAWTGAISQWLARRHDWEVKEEWISFSPGVVSALSVAVLTFTKPGDKVIVTPPVYFPFFDCVKGTGRRVAEAPLKIRDGRFHLDLEKMARLMDESTSMLLLCSPHNPGGTVWSRDELEALSALCLKNNVLVVSDEIHSDLVFDNHKHIPYALVSEEAARHCIVCNAPSKTFNVAGLATSFVVIPDASIKRAFDRMMNTLHIHTGNIPGNVALEAAFTHGDDWLAQLMEYVQENYRFLEEFISRELPRVRIMKPEATYLVWLDFREYGLHDRQLNEFIIEKAKVGLNNGARFGTGGDGFVRINIGCPRQLLQEALQRLSAAFRGK